jgi:hypothetical protein
MTPILVAALYALALARLCGLITTDKITEKLRGRLIRRICGNDPEVECDSLRVYLLTCPWCLSIWLAPPFAAAWYWAPESPWTVIPAGILAFSQVTGMISNVGR